MGSTDQQSGHGSDHAREIEQVLQTVTQDLENLHKGVIVQLAQEVSRLQLEKNRLTADIEKLHAYHQTLNTRQMELLSRQQLAQQQLWAKQLAQALASHLQALMVKQINQATPSHQIAPSPVSGLPAPSSPHSDNAHRLLASLDATFSATFKTLQQELNSYQSNLSQQLGRMQSMEQQGEALLEALVAHLRQQMHTTTQTTLVPVNSDGVMPPAIAPLGPPTDDFIPPANLPPAQTAANFDYSPPTAQFPPDRHPPIAKPIPLEAPAAPLPLAEKPRREMVNFRLGLVMVLLSTFALSVHNVVVKIVGNGVFNPTTKSFVLQPAKLLGWFDVGGFLQLGLGNSFLLLWLRMLIVLPMMIPVAMFLYPSVWTDVKKLLLSRDRRSLISIIGSGAFLFLSQSLIYIAIGQIGPGPAVTILFMYPMVTVPLAWYLFRDRPTTLRWVVMGVIFLGVALTASAMPTGAVSGAGVLIAIFSGIAFALYLIFMQIGFRKHHPIPVSLVQFATIFVLSSLVLMLPLNLGVSVAEPGGFLLSGIVLGALTLVGYLANNFGVRFMGAGRASIIASSGPVVTALLAFLLIQSPLTPPQILGIVLVTLGVGALSFERMKIQPAKKP